MKVDAGRETITLSGPPRNTAAVVRLETPRHRVVPITIEIAGQPAIYRAFVRPFGVGKSQIRLRLPHDTPPGTYSGESIIGGKPRSVVLEVEPLEQIRVQPIRTVLSAAAGSAVEFGLTIVNDGNVPFDVPRAAAFDLDAAAGQDKALGRALRAPLAQGERRVDRFFEEMRESHGGEARVAVMSGAHRLEPGEASELTCRLDVPVMAKEGYTYLGAWQIGNAGHVIVVEVTRDARPKNGKNARKQA